MPTRHLCLFAVIPAAVCAAGYGGGPGSSQVTTGPAPSGAYLSGAGASPQRRSRYDPTIRAYSEDPLNAVVSSEPQCS